jgi:hypothetical protein
LGDDAHVVMHLPNGGGKDDVPDEVALEMFWRKREKKKELAKVYLMFWHSLKIRDNQRFGVKLILS